MEIIFKKENLGKFNEFWEMYLDNNPVTFRYTKIFIEYLLNYSNNITDDLSFVYIENNEPVAIVFLPIEENNFKSISLSGSYTVAPLAKNKKYMKKVFNIIDELSKINNIKLIKFYIDPQYQKFLNLEYNFLLEYGFINTSSSTCIIDLRKSQQDIWSKIRKANKSLINGIIKNSAYEIIVYDYQNPDFAVHELYRELHKKCAGKETRRKITFDLQYQMLIDDKAALFSLKFKESYIAFAYFLHFQKSCIYMSAADDPDFESLNISKSHPLIWTACLYYKKRGIELLELSQPCGFSKVSGLDDYLDEKQINISHFKRGIGGEMVLMYRGIKYFDKNLLICDIEKFKERVTSIF
ncbi:MAG: hypothetical protein ACPLKS_04165 [Caldisericum exile]|uniref:hypothetical protein n=1 Tax=Caldisericum exile TaxID=693075 RepID=UPI003C78FB0D